jgi:PPK2 family polyphosphate:nucleotide phosphotransferase
MMYAHNRYGMVVIFQAMDAAGKDSAIGAIMSGVNPHGVRIHAFKRPTDTELEHDYLWRTQLCLPERGTIAVFNRSYYEEVLVVRVHPGILTGAQRIPEQYTRTPDLVWQQRYEDIRHLEQYLHRNGIEVVKIYLHMSRDEQRRRFLDRIAEPDKNWKFNAGDVDERAHWDAYMEAYTDCINATATPASPWYVVPADDKYNARLIAGRLILSRMQQLPISYPVLDAAHLAELEACKARLLQE